MIAPMSIALSRGQPTGSVLHPLSQFAEELVRDIFLHEQAGTGAADLALVEPDRIDHASTTLSRSASSEDDERRLSPELQRSRLPAAGRGLRMMRPTSVEPVNAIFVDVRVVHDQLAGLSVAGDDIDDSRRQVESPGISRRKPGQ